MLKKLLFIYMVISFASPAYAVSLWNSGQASTQSMFIDRKAHNVHDIVTVLISEQTTTNRSASKSTGRDTSVDGKVESWFTIKGLTNVVKNVLGFEPLKVNDDTTNFGTKQSDTTNLPAWKLSASHDFKGSGALARQDSVSARLTCEVIEVLPNRNLIIEGKQNVIVDKDTQTIILRGTIRPDDILPNNTVFSYNIADASIEFGGKGSIADKQKRGLFEKVGDFVWPF